MKCTKGSSDIQGALSHTHQKNQNKNNKNPHLNLDITIPEESMF